MKNLASVKVIKEILEKSGFHFSKSLGQNFLIDENVLDSIVSSAQIDENTSVIEIGPGFGTLTQRLLQKAKKVVCVEIDSSAIPILEENLSEFDNLKIINADVLKCDLKKISQEEFEGERVCVVANLPYYITTPIIMHLLEEDLNIDSITVMIQKEVALRLGAKEGTKDYGAITLSVNYHAVPQIITHVPPSSFIPQPKVSSTVIKLSLRDEKAVKVKNEKLLFSLIKAAFGQRRKTLLNALSNSPLVPFSKEEIQSCLSLCKIEPTRRGETLSLEEYALICENLSAK
ncbi:MAG: 16S rRNA (adenine(1518)-N(6)/adenine(1519)-N(6))-dimethyltransferase RsmA [Ruminococcaceae bacterium]|nr:16S rRNA (adenine(1518)-N(6)/adenine(1519)-N(6))-dimethyltransferase RsmA [Oscillospiraceae bacterium]